MNGSDIVASNLSRLDAELISITERRAAHISELARLLYIGEKEYAGDELCERIRECYADIRPSPQISNCAPFNRLLAMNTLSLTTAPDTVALCREFLALHGGALKYDMFLHGDGGETAGFRTAYLRGMFTDLAYRRFAEALPDLTCAYYDDSGAAAEEVYYGRARFCILPVESSADGLISTFRAVITRYDLKISLVCPIPTGESAYTVFALLRRNCDRLPFRGREKFREYFEFTVTLSNSSPKVSDILTAARYCSMPLYRIDSIPSPHGENEYLYDMAFLVSGGELECFLCYLTLETPQFTPVGLFAALA